MNQETSMERPYKEDDNRLAKIIKDGKLNKPRLG